MRQSSDISGVVSVNKHKGVTSHDIVNRLRRLYNTKQVGHTGTLDPMATGVLPVMIGRAVKASEYLTAGKKAYRAEMKLGITTDSDDITGNIITESDALPKADEVIEVCKMFEGKILQTPPMYSALKVNGQKLVDLARKNIEVEREAREIEIFSLNIVDSDEANGIYTIDTVCSKGTYIRVLCSDIGHKLGCGAVMSGLCRTMSGGFEIDNSYTVDVLENMTYEERISLLSPVESLFKDCPAVELPTFYAGLAHNGCEIYLSKISADYPLSARILLYNKGEFFALGEVRDYADGKAIKPIKQFVV